MAIIKDGTTVASITYNNTSVSTGLYDGTTVFTSDGYVVIQESAFLETDRSFVPPPYDADGYNYNASAPKKEAELTIVLGDITSYDHISFDFDNSGSSNSYGVISGTATINETTVMIFNGINQNGTIDVDTSDLSGEYSLKLKIEAKSNSSYRGYSSKSVLTVSNIRGVFNSSTPVIVDGFVIDSGTSRVPPPYDDEGYNYGGIAPTLTDSVEYNFGNVTTVNSVTFNWQNYIDENNFSWNNYGQIYAKYIDYYGIEQYIYSANLAQVSNATGTITIDTSNITGNLSLRFMVYAKSASSSRGAVSRAILKVSNVQTS